MRKILNRAMLFIGASLMLAACEKNEIPEVAKPVGEGTYVKFFFHAQDAPRSNFYLDNNKVTGVAPTTAGQVLGNAYASVYPSNAYALLPAGSYSMSVIDTVTTGKGTADVLASTSVNLANNKFYSAYLVGTKPNFDAFVIEDELPPADNTKIWWRFVNTMANIPFAVDAYAVRAAIPATDNSPAEPMEIVELGKNIDFKGYSQYVELKRGVYTFKVFPSGTEYDPATTPAFIQNSVTLASLGRVYSTQIRGTYAEKPATSNIDYWRER
ncbi:DUF4397 domain-containing protein [Pontibacter sp. FD36]|uniref:DUF4397 domain-containing protein n=1 Tax=Pontibacter sp. FD36 TaxID=2789860 RepID=UPI0018AA4EE4|nr:DUF4397 domain-containing protein [Pontibacter sp. FD36]MBF8963623.1 DUF4397 domain-containing protein [Pontibacter sp. FD36]